MLEKVKSFLSNLFNFGAQNQGVKRERDLVNDEQEENPSVMISSAAPSRKKIKLTAVGLSERENYDPSMSTTNHENQATLRFGKWGVVKDPKEILNSGATTSTSLKEEIVIVHSDKEGSSKIMQETFTFKKTLLHKPLTSADSSTQPVESGSSLRKLEKLMTEKLGDAMPSSVKKTDAGFKPPEIRIPFTFTPLATASTKGAQGPGQSSPNSRFSRSSSKSIDIDLRRRVLSNGGSVQKQQYRPIFQKLYGTPKNQKARSSLSSTLSSKIYSQSLAIQNCIRMEEKLSYKALLSQFVPKSFYDRITSSAPSSLSNSRSSSGIFVERMSPREKEFVTSRKQEQESDRGPSASKNASIIDLENESKNAEVEGGTVKKTLVYDSPIKPVIRINSLEEALALSPQYDTKFVVDLKARYTAKERERQRLLTEEEIRCKVLAENREEWENQLEQRLRKQLEITAPVINERIEEKVVLPEITDEMQMVIDKALHGYAESEVLCDAFSLTITRRDIKTLVGLNWLNDQVVNFYLTLVMERSNSNDFPKVYAFNTFFYPKLVSSGHAGLKRWTRKVDLFEKDYILIPVHLGMHWCLATISPSEKAIRYYDSMGGRNQECLTSLRAYIEAESLDKKKAALDTSDWTVECVEDIPQQMNGSDCGMFACKYAEYIARRAKITFDQKDMPYFRRRMVYEIVTRKLIHP